MILMALPKHPAVNKPTNTTSAVGAVRQLPLQIRGSFCGSLTNCPAEREASLCAR